MKINWKDFFFGIYITTLSDLVIFPYFGLAVRGLLFLVALYSVWIFIDLKISGREYEK